MRIPNRICIAAILVLLVAAALTPVEAACGGNPLIRTRSGPGTDASFIFSASWAASYYPYYPPFNPYSTPISPNAAATFWALGTGNPIIGPGDDAGSWTFPPYAWLYYVNSYYGGWYAGEVFAGWGANSIIDGCLQNNPPGTCTCVLMTDEDGATGYFALASNAAASGTWFTDLVQPGLDGAGNFSPIILQQIPQPEILQIARHELTRDYDVTLAVPPVAGPTQGIYQSGGSCDCGPTGYKIFQMSLPFGSPPPSSRDIASWSLPNLLGGVAQSGTPMGVPLTIEVLCGSTDDDIYIATQLMFDSGFDTQVVSASSYRIECRNILAEPGRPRFRPGSHGSPRTPKRSR